jgi:hypothetical protein
MRIPTALIWLGGIDPFESNERFVRNIGGFLDVGFIKTAGTAKIGFQCADRSFFDDFEHAARFASLYPQGSGQWPLMACVPVLASVR